MTVPALVLRPPETADFAALAALHAESFDRPWSAADLADFAQGPGACALLVENDGVLAGFILCRAVAGEAEILTLAVHPSARGRGFGRALVTAAQRLCAQAGAESMWLEVAQDNAPALALYAACGFQPAGRRSGYYERGLGKPRIDAILLRAALNSGG